MRSRTVVLTLAFALGVVGMNAFAAADEPDSGSWLTRMLARRPAPGKIEGKELDLLKARSAVSAQRLPQAQATLQRRQEVCQALLELAEKLGDEDLRRKAMQLDEQAFEVYKVATSEYRVSDRALTQRDKKGSSAPQETVREIRR
jgi:hypothetical protein